MSAGRSGEAPWRRRARTLTLTAEAHPLKWIGMDAERQQPAETSQSKSQKVTAPNGGQVLPTQTERSASSQTTRRPERAFKRALNSRGCSKILPHIAGEPLAKSCSPPIGAQ